MEDLFQQLQQKDDRIVQIFRNEEIEDLETFLELNERDYSRLQLTTKMIKTIEKLQAQFREKPEDCKEHEEWIEEVSNNDSEYCQENAVSWDADNPYHGISLEENISIDRILERTSDGIVLMEILQENERISDSITRKICNVLCECLKSLYGCRPSNFHKNQMAISLVQSYPSLAATTKEVPQALWFHAHARGLNRHAGRIYYRMEYLARKSEERVIKRRRLQVIPVNINHSVDLPTDDLSVTESQELLLELKYICPNQQTRARVLKLWEKTFTIRRNNYSSMLDLLESFPVLSAYNGELISYDFKMMKPAAGEFFEKWITLEQKILTTYKEMFIEIRHDFIRALAIIKEKNPSRGSKRRQADNGGNNPLNGIVHFIGADDEIPTDENIPLLIVRGSFSADSNECTLRLLGHNIPVGNDLRSAFKIYLESLTVFNITPAAFDKQFFLFFNGAVFGFETLSTTGMKFMHSLQQ
ncbi:uncharacterized protein LOC129725654 isoform X2 [Wyeomyia smithii]|uniref:uncharacterized protein LOC129725654 isoform X2 n=1 Tax=Wyeomyia smithii TaxID=174621 RepID=UPI002467DE6A|nr:uncharacterized protein LOC129725654 isoform X2 [Wyeomyia smithii]